MGLLSVLLLGERGTPLLVVVVVGLLDLPGPPAVVVFEGETLPENLAVFSAATIELAPVLLPPVSETESSRVENVKLTSGATPPGEGE